MGIGLGYVPLPWLEAGVYLGYLHGQRRLTTGWEQTWQAEYGSQVIDMTSASYDPTPTRMTVFQPRARIHVRPSGHLRPYGLAGTTFLKFEGFDDAILRGDLSYGNGPGGTGVGLTTGVGLAVDSARTRRVSAFVEIPWTKPLSPAPFESQAGLIQNLPSKELSAGQTLEVRAGRAARAGGVHRPPLNVGVRLHLPSDRERCLAPTTQVEGALFWALWVSKGDRIQPHRCDRQPALRSHSFSGYRSHNRSVCRNGKT